MTIYGRLTCSVSSVSGTRKGGLAVKYYADVLICSPNEAMLVVGIVDGIKMCCCTKVPETRSSEATTPASSGPVTERMGLGVLGSRAWANR